jgi:predicted GTPase
VITNKIDDERNVQFADVFNIFWFGDPVIASAEHGIGEDKILDIINENSWYYKWPNRDFVAKRESEDL